MIQRRVLDIYQTYNRHGWYWGAAFSRGSADITHFELADETMRAIDKSAVAKCAHSRRRLRSCSGLRHCSPRRLMVSRREAAGVADWPVVYCPRTSLVEF